MDFCAVNCTVHILEWFSASVNFQRPAGRQFSSTLLSVCTSLFSLSVTASHMVGHLESLPPEICLVSHNLPPTQLPNFCLSFSFSVQYLNLFSSIKFRQAKH